jgi:hypothetical protein
MLLVVFADDHNYYQVVSILCFCFESVTPSNHTIIAKLTYEPSWQDFYILRTRVALIWTQFIIVMSNNNYDELIYMFSLWTLLNKHSSNFHMIARSMPHFWLSCHYHAPLIHFLSVCFERKREWKGARTHLDRKKTKAARQLGFFHTAIIIKYYNWT